MYLGVRGKQIVADYEIRRKLFAASKIKFCGCYCIIFLSDTLYTITRANSHGFLLYDPESKMFLCWKQNKKRSSSRLVPKVSRWFVCLKI